MYICIYIIYQDDDPPFNYVKEYIPTCMPVNSVILQGNASPQNGDLFQDDVPPKSTFYNIVYLMYVCVYTTYVCFELSMCKLSV